ncbi:hypothetical protein [Citrobacter koseri]|uniref:hypothetical protein n=1 Tax=Citrobacter koseri TaxID=545 RepID=UPI001A2554D0|nr:hypothetical protein [Citrobacter koseri]
MNTTRWATCWKRNRATGRIFSACGSEARQFRFANNLFYAKTVFPFCTSGTDVVSPLPYAVVDSATLHNLKEAPVIWTVGPFTGADLCKHRVAEHRDGGPGFHTIRPLLRQPAGLNLHRAGILPANLYLLIPSAPFTFTGCGLHCRQALLPRGRKTAPDDKFSDAAPVQCVTLTAQSGKVTHEPFLPAPEKSTAPAHRGILTLPFQAIYS